MDLMSGYEPFAVDCCSLYNIEYLLGIAVEWAWARNLFVW